MGPAASQTQNYDLSDASDRGLRRMVTLQFLDLEALSRVGLNTETFGRLSYEQKNDEYPRTQEIGEVAHFLDFDGLIVPSARSDAKNAVVFCDKVRSLPEATLRDYGVVDWQK